MFKRQGMTYAFIETVFNIETLHDACIHGNCDAQLLQVVYQSVMHRSLLMRSTCSGAGYAASTAG